MKEIKDDTNRQRDMPCSRIGRTNILKMTVLPKAIYRFSALPIKLPVALFTDIEQKFLQLLQKHKIPQIAKVILSKKKSLFNWRIIALQCCY